MSDTKQSARDLCAEVRRLDEAATKDWVADPLSAPPYIRHDGGKKGPCIRVDGEAEHALVLAYRTAAPALGRIVEKFEAHASELERYVATMRESARLMREGGFEDAARDRDSRAHDYEREAQWLRALMVVA